VIARPIIFADLVSLGYGALHPHFHFHVSIIDGVFSEDDDGTVNFQRRRGVRRWAERACCFPPRLGGSYMAASPLRRGWGKDAPHARHPGRSKQFLTNWQQQLPTPVQHPSL
jgi:hypothetical protein